MVGVCCGTTARVFSGPCPRLGDWGGDVLLGQRGRQCRGCFCCFFFQAEDGIRDDLVTGVQTCALPISLGLLAVSSRARSCCFKAVTCESLSGCAVRTSAVTSPR